MAEYGGHENYDDVLGRLHKAEDAVDGLIAKEQVYRKELESTSSVERQSTRVRKEGAEVRRREKTVADVEAPKTKADTAAIERNTEARRRQNAEIRRSQTNVARAVRGAQDPAFGQAYGMAQERGGQVSQYAMRQQIDKLGSRRAQDISHAIGGGFTPGGSGAKFPRTRIGAGELGLETAEAELEQATRALKNARARKAVTEGEREQLLETQQSAKMKRDAARLELESARNEAAARAENAAAARREAAMRSKVAQAHSDEVLTRRPQQLALPAAGQTAQMRTSTAQVFTKSTQPAFPNRPGAVAEGGVIGGGVPGLDKAGAQAALAAAETKKLADAQNMAAISAEKVRGARIAEYYAGAEANSRALTQQVARQGAAFGTVSQAMYRHGALTSEFIASAARGETTLKELGNQGLITAGKFGGWTAAATAVYGVGAAIGQVGKGAVDAYDGAQQLTRVITQDLPDKGGMASVLASLAQEFNVPIDQAADAVYRMGQRFHSFPQAVEAARASLYSFKTGEVDVATSTQNLIAITNGFGLSTKELTSVYDQINEAQNVFGVKIGDTEAGLAKAAGTYRNAGGDLDYLLGVMVAVSQSTGRSGTEIGTAISRGINEINRPANQLKLSNLGVDVDPANFQKTLKSALQVAADNPNGDLRGLATGLFGNQYARIIAPVLADQTILNKALKDLTPEKAKGSAQRELSTVLGETKEQVAALGIGLQVLGERLAEAGVFAPFMLFLKGLNQGIKFVNDLANAFNKLPDGIQQAVTLLGEGYVLLLAMRKLGATDALAGGPFGFLTNEDKRLKTYALRGLRDAKGQAYNDVERSAAGTFRASEAAAITAGRVTKFKPEVDRALDMPELDPQRKEIMAKADALQDDAVAANNRFIAAERETLELKRVALGLEIQEAEVQKARGAAVRSTLVANNLSVPASMAAPNMRGTVNVSPENADVAEELAEQERIAAAAGVKTAAGARIAAGSGREMGRFSQRVRSVTQGLTSYANRDIRNLNREVTAQSASMRGVNRVMTATGTGLTKGAMAIESAVGGIKGTGGKLKNFLSGFGILDAALVGYLAIEGLGSGLEEGFDKELKSLDKMNRDAPNATAQRDRAKKLAEQASQTQGASVGEVWKTFREEISHPKNLIGAFTGSYRDPVQRRQDRAKAAKGELDIDRDRQALQESQRQRGGPVPFQYSGELMDTIDKDAEARRKGLISQAEFDKRMARHAVEAKQLTDATKGNVLATSIVLAGAVREQGGEGGYAKSLRTLDPKALEGEREATAARVDTVGLTPRNMTRMAQQYREAQRRWGKKTDAASVQNLNAARESYYQTLTNEVNRELQLALLGAGNESERRAAYARAQQRYRQAERGVRERRVKELKDKAAEGNAGGGAEGADTGDPTPHRRAGIDLDRAGNLQKAAKAIRDRAKKVGAGVKKKDRELQLAELELKNAAYEDRQSGRDIQAELEVSQTTDEGRQAAIRVKYAERTFRDATRTWARGSRQYKQALTSLNNARLQQAEQIRSDANEIASLQAQITQAQLQGDDVGGARAQINAAQGAAGRARTPKERLQARLDVITANNALEDAIKDREQARYDLLISQTDDPVKQARLRRDQARSGIAGTRGAERLRAQATYNDAQRNYRTQRIDSRLETINFNLEMEKITSDEAARQIQSLANLKGVSRAKRRELLLQAKRLRDQDAGESEINIGNIKLPSLAEVRRAVIGGGSNSSQRVTNNNNVNLYVDRGTNMDELGRTLEGVLDTQGLSSSRLMGVG